MKYFPTSKADQSLLESDFGVYRAMDGANVDPNGLELNWRISRHILTKILDDKSFDVKSLKLPLENYIEELKNDSDDEDNDADMDPNDDNNEESNKESDEYSD